MIKERMIRSLPNVMMAIIIAVSVFLCVTALPETGFSGWQIVDKPTDYPTSVDPYEVIVYEHANFTGEYMRFKLEPGMRQKLVPDLKGMNDKISSIQVGSKVAVATFTHADFGGMNSVISYDSQKVFHPNDSVSSLIVFPKEMLQPSGVLLYDRGSGDYLKGNCFFPLPEFLNQTEARYSTIGSMNDDANEVDLYPYDPKSPAYGKVNVTLYEHANFKGRWITLPGADGSIPPGAEFLLRHYQFDDTASSVVVRWTGPSQAPQTQLPLPSGKPAGSSSTRVTAPPASSSTRVAAPPASGETAPNVSGQWKSNIGLVYDIKQVGDRFEWTVANSDEKGEGTIKGNDLSASWKGQQGAGSSDGKVTAVDSSGKVTEIKWNNGVRFYR